MFRRASKDPVEAALDTLRRQHRENNQRGVGLMNMPKHRRAKEDLVGMGADAVPALIAVLTAEREGDVEDGVAGDIAEVLGEIGDPRAVGPLLAGRGRRRE
jgi:HEAT repeat protein